MGVFPASLSWCEGWVMGTIWCASVLYFYLQLRWAQTAQDIFDQRFALGFLALVPAILSMTDQGPLGREGMEMLLSLVWYIKLSMMAMGFCLWRMGRHPGIAAGLCACYFCICFCCPQQQGPAGILEYPGFLSSKECSRIVSAAEAHGSLHGWHRMRHPGAATEDIPLPDIATLNPGLPAMLAARLQPISAKHFGGTLVPVDAFIVRYAGNRQTDLKVHRDGGHVTYSVALSSPDDYVGGGVRFPKLRSQESNETANNAGRTLRLPLGNVLIQPARVRHEGVRIERGTRYLLISFNRLKHLTWYGYLISFFDLYGAMSTEVVLHRRHAVWSEPWEDVE